MRVQKMTPTKMKRNFGDGYEDRQEVAENGSCGRDGSGRNLEAVGEETRRSRMRRPRNKIDRPHSLLTCARCAPAQEIRTGSAAAACSAPSDAKPGEIATSRVPRTNARPPPPP